MDKHKSENLLQLKEYPLSSEYDPEWIRKNEMGPNVLWLTESLTQMIDIKPGMRVLDLGCGTALSSIFLANEFNVQVWATDLWINASDNLRRIRESNVEDKVFPIHAEAHALPYADNFFDVIIGIDSYHYFGSDIHYLEFYLLKLLKIGGQLGIVSPASPQPVPNPLPHYLGKEWYWLKSLDWWQDQWARNPGLENVNAEMIPNGWELWVRWNEFIFSGELINEHNTEQEKNQVLEDKGRYLGFLKMAAVKREF